MPSSERKTSGSPSKGSPTTGARARASRDASRCAASRPARRTSSAVKARTSQTSGGRARGPSAPRRGRLARSAAADAQAGGAACPIRVCLDSPGVRGWARGEGRGADRPCRAFGGDGLASLSGVDRAMSRSTTGMPRTTRGAALTLCFDRVQKVARRPSNRARMGRAVSAPAVREEKKSGGKKKRGKKERLNFSGNFCTAIIF